MEKKLFILQIRFLIKFVVYKNKKGDNLIINKVIPFYFLYIITMWVSLF